MRGGRRFAYSVTLAVALAVALAATLAGCAEQAAPEMRPVPAALRGAAEAPLPAPPEAAPPPAAPAAKSSLFPGTGVLVDLKSLRRPLTVGRGGSITLNFADAELREVLRAVLSETLGLNYMVDPKVQGKVTIQTSRPLARDAVLGVLENVLRLNGAAMVDDAGMLRIVPAADASRGLGRRAASSLERGLAIRIVPLEHTSAAEMEGILKPFLPAGRTMTADTQRNVLILTGTARELSGLIDMVETFDVDWLAGMSFGMFPLEATDAKTMAGDLANVFGDPDKGPLAGQVRFVPIERMNAILVVAKRPDYLEKARQWIERFDRGGSGTGRRLYVYQVQNRRAEDLAPVLTEIFATGPAGTPAASVAPGLTPQTIRSTPPATQTPPATATPAATGSARAPATQAATGSARAPATPGAATRPTPPVNSQSAGLAPSGEIRIVADGKKNALLILATPGDYLIIKSALKKLDVVPLQVLIEATILEVTLIDVLQYGLQWFIQSGQSQFHLTNTSVLGSVSSVVPGFSYFFTPASAQVAVSALDAITDIKVISSPQLMVLDNETATLQVGDQVPIAVQSAVDSTDPTAPIVNSIQLLDTGVILEVTPRVNDNGLVILDIMQEVSDAGATTTSTIDSPTINRRRITTSVAVQSGETIALGGLIRDTDDVVVSGIPLLMDIPLIGNLFKTTTDTQRRTELLVLLTPRVVRDVHEARQVTEELRQKLRGLQRLEKKLR